MHKLAEGGVLMGKLLLVVLVLSLLSLPVMAQDAPKAEVFGGYQFTRLGGTDGINMNGWNAAVTGNLNRWFGLTGDFSGTYKSVGADSLHVYTYTFGPVISSGRNKTFSPFVHALFGGFHTTANFEGAPISGNGFALQLGGGLDVNVSRHLGVRVIQGDWIMLHASGGSENKNARISAGIVLRF